jgi:hypothetical protein
MITQELTDQVRTEVKRLKEVQDQFLQTYKRYCVHFGGPEWRRAEIEMVFHRVRQEVIPIMEGAGMDPKAVQALCAWAEKLLMNR